MSFEVNNLQTMSIRRPGWLVNIPFDLTLIVGVMTLALCVGGIALIHPNLLGLLIYLDMWFLGYQHVVATFTRLTFDNESFVWYKNIINLSGFGFLKGQYCETYKKDVRTID